jgi:putative ABC transport system permease protein
VENTAAQIVRAEALEGAAMRRKPLWPTVLIADLRFGARVLKRNPGVAIVGVLTLALGIGANTAIFSLLHAVLLRPLPYRDPGQLVWASQYAPRVDETLVPAGTFLAWRNQNRSFEDIAAYDDHLCDGNLTTGAEPVRLDRCAEVSANFLSLLGVQPALGRSFSPQEDAPGAHGVMILSDGFWRRRFGANPNDLGQSVRLDNTEYTVVGILPANFVYPSQLQPDALVPLPLPSRPDWSQRESDDMSVIARLKQGIRLQQAVAELRTITQSLTPQYPQAVAENLAGADLQLLPLHQRLVGDTRPALLLLMSAVGLVLLIACVNMANLLLARAAAREREFAVRSALGAARARIIRQLLTEGFLLAALGSAAGLLIAWATLDVVRLLRPGTLDYFGDARLNGATFCFTLLVSLVTAILFSLAPALLASQAGASIALHEAGGKNTAAPSRQKLGSVLVAAE